jgi:membrane fusion protein, multidrug efflux system
MIASAAVAVLAGAAWYGWDYLTVGRYLVSTDDAYVQADNTTVAPKISGYLSEVLVGDNESVKAGEVLARIDDRDFKVALDQAKADVVAANEGALVSEPQANGPAAKAGIEPGDVITSVNGETVKDARELARTIGSLGPQLPHRLEPSCYFRRPRSQKCRRD